MALVRAGRLIGFHHDPWHDDDTLDSLYANVNRGGVDLTPAREGMTLTVASTV